MSDALYDTHAHLVSNDHARYPPAPLKGQLRPGDLDNPMTAERLLREMDASNVEKAVVVQRAHVYGYDNSYVVDSAARYSDRLRAVVVIDALAADAAGAVRRWVGDGGARGVRLTEPHKGADTAWFASSAAGEVWAETTRFGGSICLQMYRWNRDDCLAAVPRVLEAFPQTRVAIEHVSNLLEASPTPEMAIDPPLRALAAYPNASFKLTTINLARMARDGVPAPPLLNALVSVFGAERLMWGSDVAQSPQGYEEMTALGRAALRALEPDQWRRVASATASRLYH